MPDIMLMGDTDGSLGSGTAGHVVLDCGDPARGFKSFDWWGTFRSCKRGWSPEHAEETFCAIGRDRWRLSPLYAMSGDAGFLFDCVDRIEPFSVVVEDCVSIGRAFGGGVASCLSRPASSRPPRATGNRRRCNTTRSAIRSTTARPQGNPWPPVKRPHMHALPERAALEIRFPRVEGYRQSIRNRIAVDWDNLAPRHGTVPGSFSRSRTGARSP